MDTSMGMANKRKRSAEENDGFRPSPYQLPSPISRPVSSSLSPSHIGYEALLGDLSLSGGSGTGISSCSQEFSGNNRSFDPSTNRVYEHDTPGGAPLLHSISARHSEGLHLSDQDTHLVEFPDAPPAMTGGPCEVYVAVHRPSNLKLAMKRPRFDFPTEDMLRRFRREAEIWSEFRHPNILPFFGTIKIRHRLYIISPWRRLGDLLAFVQFRIKLIRQGDWLSDERISPEYRHFDEARIIREIAAGLAYLHSINVVHGDMKAKNVLLDDEGRAQICDFGLTKTLKHSVTSTELKGVGSIRWQSPELFQGEPKSQSSDVYAFGMTISEILSGNYPFPELKEQTAVVCAIMVDSLRPPFQPLSLLGINFKPLWIIAARCWEAAAKDRPQITGIVLQLEPPDSFGRLSCDILQSIFLFASYSGDNLPSPSVAVTVSHVCRSWRTAAIESPSLWSLVEFKGHPPFELPSLHLVRSKSAGLEIVIWGEYDTNETLQLIELLWPHVTRWRWFEIRSDLSAGWCSLFFKDLHHQPVLEGLRIAKYGPVSRQNFRPFRWGLPRSSHPSIGPRHVNGNSGLLSQLTDLTIILEDSVYPLTAQTLLAIFAQCAPSICRIRIQLSGCAHLRQSTLLPQPVHLPHLQCLDLFNAADSPLSPSWALDIYNSIMAPEMQYHDLDVCILEHLSLSTAFPFPNLSKLTISQGCDLQVGIPKSVFIQIFSKLPRLRELIIDNLTSFNPKILASTCDMLRKLTIRQRDPLPGPSGVRDMVKFRQRHARQRGKSDSLVHVKLDGLLLPEDESIWLRGCLKVFECAF